MKAIAYHVLPEQKQLLVYANKKKHGITIVSESLSLENVAFALKKEVLLILNVEPLQDAIISSLAKSNVELLIRFVEKQRDKPMVYYSAYPFCVAEICILGKNDEQQMAEVVDVLDSWARGDLVGYKNSSELER